MNIEDFYEDGSMVRPPEPIICGNTMALRDWFAGQALQQFAKTVMEKREYEPDKSSPDGEKTTTYAFDGGIIIDPEYTDYVARAAYQMADAMLAARKQK